VSGVAAGTVFEWGFDIVGGVQSGAGVGRDCAPCQNLTVEAPRLQTGKRSIIFRMCSVAHGAAPILRGYLSLQALP